ncbi:hypothetical protein BJY16_007678 [Actinoplanes octamycinicus]|uniref:Uncharacterized protein n=1 Tax=Actinoplanes octamycinicus TaxID=135948 RepID=A0A7W7H5C0_9ACTN|nr:DUF5682 family protein [Actinoplanes octamycinicus]MBB4744219.1 hypothetical protein [Actinoplanes octamycinicus]GIE56822.1 hypothetical protein Aoc01nite_22240 [Actinoplanes octamycinicus]
MSNPFDALRAQLLGAAESLADGPAALPEILAGIVDDVDHAVREPLEIFPVCHHSPASALAMLRRLREKQPAVIYLELCEDLQPLLTELRNCRLPVALQAFASELDGFPKESAPLSVIAPITEASAEYQAIAYALDTPGVELVLVDRSTDHVFQWQPDLEGHGEATEPEDDLHGDAVGVEIGDLRPRFAELEEHLLHHGRVRHWSEWWDQYVEQPLAGADHDTYRQVMTMVGSLFRRLAPHDTRRYASDEDRERYMWTRIREHLAATGTDPADCLYVCGAFHAASRLPEVGSAPGTPDFAITPRTATTWLYGLIPSSHSAIEAQFGLAPGSVSIAAATWQKQLTRSRLKPFRLDGQQGGRLPAPLPGTGPVTDHLTGYLAGPPALDGLDEEELRGWCVDIVRLARRNGYLASTADAIAVFETSILLAGMRGRVRPTPYDFQDAAVTCIEKDSVPGRRDVRRLCEILLGGDRIGQVGYDALPPLARDVYDRLAPLELNLQQRSIQRALLDLAARPELAACSQLLWMLRYLLPDQAVRPIMGSRKLGERHIQESWDLDLGRHQRTIIELGYEGVTVEQVLEQRLRRDAWDPKATAATALKAVENSMLFLQSPRLTDELGVRAVELLAAERTVDDAPDVLRRIRRLLGHYRATRPVLPSWCERFVREGYAHYCTLLPTAFVDEETGVRQVGAMLGFLFSMESLALSLGCDRTQLEIAVRQSHPEVPAKIALLWAARNQLGDLPLAELRERVDGLLGNPLVVPAFPQYVSGFVQALDPVPRLAPFVVETLSKAFGRLPDPVLLPWLPNLITTLKQQAAELVPVLTREAGRTFPGTLAAIDSWTPPWLARRPSPATPAVRAPAAGPAGAFLAARPATTDAVAELLGCSGEWSAVAPGGAGPAVLLTAFPEPAEAVAALLGA